MSRRPFRKSLTSSHGRQTVDLAGTPRSGDRSYRKKTADGLAKRTSRHNTLRFIGRIGWVLGLLMLLVSAGFVTPASAQQAEIPFLSDTNSQVALPEFVAGGPEAWASPQRLGSTLQVMLLLAVMSLAPAIVLMTTCFVRIVVVLTLLRQALGAQQLPPTQVITSIALFMTLLIMSPIWKQVHDDAIVPYTDPDVEMSLTEAWQAGIQPVRHFMSQQIEIADNSDDVWLFLEYLPQDTATPTTYAEVPLQALVPAFMMSELKTAFLIGFQVYLPFLIVDIVVATVTMSMGMLMLPPAMISLPFKLLLFVLVDGWHLVIGMLLESFATFT